MQKWTIKEVISLNHQINVLAKRYGFGIAIGGSLSYKGESKNDLDLIVYNLKSKNGNHVDFLNEFCLEFECKIVGVPDHSKYGDDKLIYVFKTENGRKLDLFLVNFKFKDRIKGLKSLVRKIEKKYEL